MSHPGSVCVPHQAKLPTSTPDDSRPFWLTVAQKREPKEYTLCFSTAEAACAYMHFLLNTEDSRQRLYWVTVECVTHIVEPSLEGRVIRRIVTSLYYWTHYHLERSNGHQVQQAG